MNILKAGEKILSTLNKAGYSAYFVGGYVRDKMMGNTPSDIDIATAALPHEVKRLFDHTIDTGLKHGTVTVILDDIPFEVTTYRVENDYENHRKPKSVKFVSDIEKDLSRRDFTINAMAYHFEDGLIDPFGRQNDIKNKIIRCMGNPLKRFEEDALRMLRCIRFACQTDFQIEEKTLCAIKEKAHLLKVISKERIFAEFVKSLTSKHPEHLKVCHETGLFEYFLPEMSICFKTPQNTIYHLYNVG
ncbi:MAG: CCA tRNA nucleotidyltransferase, partial [Clostridia bacterium]|nr:CCA tRNA nucleotidyltransferase [Clostridia bacterium]